MKNTYKLLWSDEALKGFMGIVSYLENKFSEKDVKKFIVKFEKQLALIKKNPLLFPVSSKSKIVRRSIVSKLNPYILLLMKTRFI